MKHPRLPQPQVTERKLPTVFRQVIKLEWQRRFSLWERLGILFGGSLLVQVGIATQHSPGEIHPLFLGRVSKSTTPDERHREIIENMLAEKKESPIQHEPSRRN